MEVKEEVKTYQVRMTCNRCKQGEMIPTGIMLVAGQYDHKCNCCGHRETYKVIYPVIRYESKKAKKEQQ